MDPDLIRQVTIKNFDNFVNHRSFLPDTGGNGIFSNSLFLLQNQKWRDMRSTLTPAFTGSKMRMMFQLITSVAAQAVESLKSKENIQSGYDIDMKNFFSHFTSDVIASVAFGIDVDSFSNPNHEFYLYGSNLLKFNFIRSIKFFLCIFSSNIAKFLNIQLWSHQQLDYFSSLVLDGMKHRVEHNILRPDMINMLMEARGVGVDGSSKDNKKTHEWSDIEIVAQCFLFFVAGFESTATLLAFATHELMENQDVQQKLVNEVFNVEQDLNGQPLSYEQLTKMSYMDMVVSEVLRKWPTTPGTDRVCTKDTTFENPDGLGDFTVREGENIFIPFVGLHRDSKYYSNPDKFDPERFSKENVENIQPFTYLPFGVGPRACIGNRLALLETKIILYYLIKEFHLEASKQSTIPLDLSGSMFQLQPKKGFWLKLRERTKQI